LSWWAAAVLASVPCAAQQPAGAPGVAAHESLPPLDARTRARVLRLERRAAPPADPTNRVADDPRAARLGQFLFFDARLSRDGRFSCASCHDPAQAFTDGRRVSEGRVPLARNAPTLLDVARQRWLFWDGRADSLWAQALQPLEHKDEFDTGRVELARRVHGERELRTAYEALFGALPELGDERRFPPGARPCADEADPRALAWLAMEAADRRAVERVLANLGKALAAYQRRLLPRGSPFDRYVAALREQGEAATGTVDEAARASAYPAAARRGLELFLGKADCRRCHAGATFSDQEFHNIGLAGPDGGPPRDAGRHAGLRALRDDPFNAHGTFSDQRDGARARELGQLVAGPETWATFRTPTLRNVARTAPYMHAGQFATLREVLQYYSTLEGSVPVGHHGETVLQPLKLGAAELDDLAAFLDSLTDPPLAEELLRAPPSPLPDEPPR